MRALMMLGMAIAPKSLAMRHLLDGDAVWARRLDLGPIGEALRFDDEHGARRIREYVLRHRPEQELHDARSTVRTDDNEIGRQIGSKLHDLT